MTVAQAASYLGISAEAVRARIQRGTLEHTKAGKTVYVLLPDEQTRHNGQQNERHDERNGERHDADRTQKHNGRYDEDQTVLLNDLREQIKYLREVVGTRDRELETRAEELAEMRRIVAGLVQRIPELEPARDTSPDAPERPQTPSEGASGSEGREGDAGQEKPSWWRRLWGAE
jgi:excisionase family DNA binding protein